MVARIINFRIFLALLFVLASGYAFADFGELSSFAASLGFKPEDEEKLLSGEVISVSLPETTDKMLAEAFAIYAPMYAYNVADLALSERVFEGDTLVIASGRIDPLKIEASLSKAKFTGVDAEELKQLISFSGGEAFNLSTKEIAKLKASVTSGNTSAKALSKVYRDILAGRIKAYLKSGIQGIAPYDRGKGIETSVASDLEAMTKASHLSRDAPGLYRSFLYYPKNQSPHLKHGFFWVKRKIQNRPAFVLEHRILEKSPAGLVILRRELFVGHSYNAAQAISGAYTISNKGMLFFSALRSTSDQLAGTTNGKRRALARKLMRDEQVTRFKSLRKRFAK
jgi:hypothetical protein